MKNRSLVIKLFRSFLFSSLVSCAFLTPLQADLGTEQEERSVRSADGGFEQEESFDKEVELPSFDQVKQFLAEKIPEAHAELERIRSKEPIHIYAESIERVVEFYTDFHNMMERNKESADAFLSLTRAKFKAQQLAEQYFKIEGEEQRKKIVSAIRTQTTIYFNSQSQLYALEIEAAMGEIEEMKAELDEMRSDRDEWIDDYVTELLDEGDEKKGERDEEKDEEEEN